MRKYANILNRAKVATGGSSIWRLPLKKFYEIPGSGAILFSDLPIDEREFFKGRVIEVDPARIVEKRYEDVVRKQVMEVLTNYDRAKSDLQLFRSDKDRFDKSFEGRALEMRAITKKIR